MDESIYKISYDDELDFRPTAKAKKKTHKKKGERTKILFFITLLIFVNFGLIFYIALFRKPVQTSQNKTLLSQKNTQLAPEKSITPISPSEISKEENILKTDETAKEIKNGQENDKEKNNSSPNPLTFYDPNQDAKIGSLLSFKNNNPGFSSENVYTTLFPTQIIPSLTPLFTTPSLTPSPTLIPSLTPTPSPSDETNIEEIIENKDSLDGTVVKVVGFLVTGNIGQESCIYQYICNYSIVFVNDSWDWDRNQDLDTEVRMNITEHEEDYFISKKLIFDALIDVQDDGSVILIKQYN